jgi:hypothetical protein
MTAVNSALTADETILHAAPFLLSFIFTAAFVNFLYAALFARKLQLRLFMLISGFNI